jgi:flagellin
MRINNNVAALNTNKQFGINNLQVARNIERLSSGRQINRAADNAAGLAISEKLRTQIIGLNQAGRNSQDAMSLLQIAEGGMSNIGDMLGRVRELAVQSASDTNQTDVDRKALNSESREIINEIDDVAETTQFNEMQVLNGDFAEGGERGSLTIQTGANEGQTMDISIGDMSAESLGVADVDLSTGESAREAIGTVDNAINDVSMQRAELGAMQNRLEFRIQNLNIQAENATAAESRIRDTDMASAMTALTRDNILSQVTNALQAQANAMPQGVLNLLNNN